MIHGEKPEFSDQEIKNIVLRLLDVEEVRTHSKKNGLNPGPARDSLTQRMQLIESAQEWVKEL